MFRRHGTRRQTHPCSLAQNQYNHTHLTVDQFICHQPIERRPRLLAARHPLVCELFNDLPASPSCMLTQFGELHFWILVVESADSGVECNPSEGGVDSGVKVALRCCLAIVASCGTSLLELVHSHAAQVRSLNYWKALAVLRFCVMVRHHAFRRCLALDGF